MAGAGKTMTAGLIQKLLPELSKQEALETRILFDIADEPQSGDRPFRSPHHSISLPGLVGEHVLPHRVKSVWPITVFYFLMNYRSFR